ncbi:hypothetical protein GCM10029964_107260 [Kibdelosporangium lantanae]
MTVDNDPTSGQPVVTAKTWNDPPVTAVGRVTLLTCFPVASWIGWVAKTYVVMPWLVPLVEFR